ncbi:predicted protein [Uncinocarpus reesii 1704]|uniref:Altered inheritance of mitochondria protein 9, mitochondrial n=1 Tax=Uncinocarpus reesii (strain UAMH 1704) TaxID=336963 RepID=C4JHR2_UNCRE|nr:uncharacterized protein UREG_02748 [Uncinocarpus reesii 1704]EEP77899.1 predicted protein [Uncinocarpus reesii 1704]
MLFIRAAPSCCWLSKQAIISRSPVVTTFVLPNSVKRHSTYDTATPHIVAEKSDGTCKCPKPVYLFGYSDDSQWKKFRRRTFTDIEETAGCVRVMKCREGLNNKVYLLTMNNGSEIIARLPNPIAGPAYYTTASEVATREFIRDAMKIPAPRIIAWSADRNNPVGAEYILEEKAPGVPLGRLWYQWPMECRLEMVLQIVKIEHQFASMQFSKCGCIYFKHDILNGPSGGGSFTTSTRAAPSIYERFTLGPLVSSDTRPLEFVEAMATNEKRFVKAHGRPRLNYHRSTTKPESPDELLDLLDRYLKLMPAMVPSVTHSPTLWHPDLHLDNVFVDPKSRQITRIIDWQSAAVMPLYYQCGIPRMFKHPGGVSNNWDVPKLPDDYDSLDQSEKDKIDSNQKSEICHKYYLAETMDQNPRHWAALKLENLDVRTEPSRLVVNVWEDHDVFFLRRALHSIAKQWQYLCPDSGPCPVTFGEQELEAHEAEEESMSNVSQILALFQDNWGLPPDGMVDSAVFDEVQRAVAELRDSFIAGGDDEAERQLFSKLWPYRNEDS